MLQIIVGKTVRALHQARRGPADAHDLAGGRDGPQPQLVPECNRCLVADTLPQAKNIHLGGRRRHWVRLLLHNLLGGRVDVLPGPCAQGPELHNDARQGRDRCEELPFHTHVALRLVNYEESRLLRGIRQPGLLQLAYACWPAHRGLVAPPAVDEECHHCLILNPLLQAIRHGVSCWGWNGGSTAQVPVVVPDTAQLDHRGLRILGQQPPDLHLSVA
mmetsp:Transcript_98732/g.287996  ORF Transcript_98732/g.287996 Transcript_98732/m.287996 type:complete len:217 (+) Transcript_98732:1240-1890(+)